MGSLGWHGADTHRNLHSHTHTGLPDGRNVARGPHATTDTYIHIHTHTRVSVSVLRGSHAHMPANTHTHTGLPERVTGLGVETMRPLDVLGVCACACVCASARGLQLLRLALAYALLPAARTHTEVW